MTIAFQALRNTFNTLRYVVSRDILGCKVGQFKSRLNENCLLWIIWWICAGNVNVAFIVHSHRAGIGELRFCLHQVFKHALLLCVPLYVSWAFLVCFKSWTADVMSLACQNGGDLCDCRGHWDRCAADLAVFGTGCQSNGTARRCTASELLGSCHRIGSVES